MNDSKKFQLNKSDVSALGKNALLVGAAASLTYAIENLDTLDLGTMGILFVPIVAVVLETAIKWIKDNTK
jgi:membrane protein DedA with SNARE-associated domain